MPDDKSDVAKARNRLNELRETRTRVDERLTRAEGELRDILKELKSKGYPQKLAELETLKEEKINERDRLVKEWTDKIESVREQIGKLQLEQSSL